MASASRANSCRRSSSAASSKRGGAVIASGKRAGKRHGLYSSRGTTTTEPPQPQAKSPTTQHGSYSREQGPAAGHDSLARIAQGTVCKLLAEQEVKPHKVRYYLERRDPEFEAKMAEVLSVYQEVAILRAVEARAAKVAGDADTAAIEEATPNVAYVSYDEKPGIQAIANTAPDLPPIAGKHDCVARDHEYKRLGT